MKKNITIIILIITNIVTFFAMRNDLAYRHAVDTITAQTCYRDPNKYRCTDYLNRELDHNYLYPFFLIIDGWNTKIIK